MVESQLLHTPAPPLMLEREAELAALQAMLGAAQGGDGRLVVVEGNAGIGKTRLLAEARQRAEEADFEVLSARGGELEGEFAFGIVRQLFEVPLAAASAAERSELLAGAAGLCASLFASAPAASASGGAEGSFAMLHGLYWLAANFTARRPTLLVVDDLHWADEPSQRWLAYLAHRLDGLPLLLLLGMRPPAQATTPVLTTGLVADPAAVVIRPATLGKESADVLARVRLGAEPDAAFTAALHEASGGNPLYLVAVLDALCRNGTAPTVEEVSRVLDLGPQAIARTVAGTIARLPADAVELLRAAAIVGDQAALPLAAALARIDVAAALAAATVLVDADLLRRDNPLEFTHPIVRSAVLEGMTVGERVGAHRRAGEALLDGGASPEQAAGHLAQTVPAHDAFVSATLRRAAEQSMAQGAPEAAVAYLRRALEEPPAPEERLDVLHQLGIAQLNTSVAAGSDYLRRSLAELDDVAARPDVSLAYAQSLIMLGNQREAIDLIRSTSDAVRTRDPVLHWRLEGLLIIAAQYDPALYALAAERLGAVRRAETDRRVTSGLLLAACASEEARRGVSLGAAVDYAERALASGALEPEDEVFRMHALFTLTLAGKAEEAARAYAAAIAASRTQGNLNNVSVLHLFRGLLRTQRGELLAAEEDIDWSSDPAVGQSPLHAAYHHGYLADVLIERGELDAARDLVNRPLPECVEGHRIYLEYARGRLRLESGRPGEALAAFTVVGQIAEPLGIRNPAWVPWRSQAAIALHRLGRTNEARELARQELELARLWGAPRTVGISLRALGLIEEGETGQDLLRQAVELLAHSPARLEHARALIDLGATLRRANNRRDARQLLREGIDIAHRCGATPLVELANAELAATGAHARTILLCGLDALTASERRVAQMAAEDLSNKEIAQALFVTVKTVEQHLGRAYRKLDISSRRQLGAALAGPAAASAPA
jgi:DNA-binding CsgD family transcriptional regulator